MTQHMKIQLKKILMFSLFYSFICQKCIDGVVKLLRDLANSPYAPEYDISGITDPLLHIRLLRLLNVLGQGDADASDTMNDVLAQASKLHWSKLQRENY